MAAAQTGTGKTAAFVLPILSKLSNPKNNYKGHQLRALILTPTRELAAQIYDNVVEYSNYLQLRSTVIFGGVNQKPQVSKIRNAIQYSFTCFVIFVHPTSKHTGTRKVVKIMKKSEIPSIPI